MSDAAPGMHKIHGFCGLCIARCGTIATVESGRFTRLDPDPSHPTGAAICAKGRAAPEIVYSKDRLTQPLRRTAPKGAPNPKWKPISWDEALDEIATNLRRIAAEHGPQAIAFGQSSASTTAIGDSGPYIRRLMNAIGTPNLVNALDLCGWSRGFATRYVYGHGSVATGSAGGAMADIANSGCLILWGYNPSFTRLTHATATVEAHKRGMKLIVIDPRHAGLTNKADVWLRVRPGTDGALALGLAHLMIERGWYDAAFLREWTNAPTLVRSDTGRLLRESDLAAGGDVKRLVAWSASANAPAIYDPATGRYTCAASDLVLEGEHTIELKGGTAVACRPVFSHYVDLCQKFTPQAVAATCWVPPAQLEETARLLWHARPVSYYAWSGHEQHANTTETARAMATLYALTGSFDAPGGNVLMPSIPAGAITGDEFPTAKGMAPVIGVAERPLGPARWGNVAPLDFYAAALAANPYPVRALVCFGTNLIMAQSAPDRGRAALAELDFFVHADLFMNPTAEQADIVLPIASCFEREALKIGFEISPEAQGHVQFRTAIVPPPGQARSDTDFIFALAERMGLSAQFWDGDVAASYRQQLGPSGITLEELKAKPEGIARPLTAKFAKHAQTDAKGKLVGFPTPSGKVELWSETFLDHGLSALPEIVEPKHSPVSRPDLARQFPLVLTCAKPTVFCQTQHRAIGALRKRAPHPEVELHPEAAAARGITAGAWVAVETPAGAMRAKARLNDKLDQRVVIGEHGWWQASKDIDASGYDPFSASGANFNRTIDPTDRDPVSGTPAHRANLCEVRLAEGPAR